MIDHNLYAYRDGALLANFRGRYQPPAPYYLPRRLWVPMARGLLAAFPICRLRLIECGIRALLDVSEAIVTATWLALSIALICNVSFFLYCRQCRYYSLTIILSIAVVYQYLHWKGRSWEYVLMNVTSILLLTTNYLSYAALYAVLACDYFLFGRRQLRLKIGGWLLLLGPQIPAGIATVSTYYPLTNAVVPPAPGRSLFLDKLTLLCWNFRDLNNCEFRRRHCDAGGTAGISLDTKCLAFAGDARRHLLCHCRCSVFSTAGGDNMRGGRRYLRP